jgi:transcriptional regulator with XRE-family HTH domain
MLNKDIEEEYKAGQTDNVYLLIGMRVRLLRKMCNISQTKLGKMLNVTFQQIQKYERGTSKFSIDKLIKLSEFFSVGLDFFLEDVIKLNGTKPFLSDISAFSESKNHKRYNMKSKESTELLHHFNMITKKSVRDQVLQLVRELSQKGKVENNKINEEEKA